MSATVPRRSNETEAAASHRLAISQGWRESKSSRIKSNQVVPAVFRLERSQTTDLATLAVSRAWDAGTHRLGVLLSGFIWLQDRVAATCRARGETEAGRGLIMNDGDGLTTKSREINMGWAVEAPARP